MVMDFDFSALTTNYSDKAVSSDETMSFETALEILDQIKILLNGSLPFIATYSDGSGFVKNGLMGDKKFEFDNTSDLIEKLITWRNQLENAHFLNMY